MGASLQALGRLLRVSLTASALADAAAGILLGAGMWPSGARPWMMLAASACVYHGGMALNDWADSAEDSGLASRAARPIPSGAIARRTAFGIALLLLICGPVLAARVSTEACAALVGVAILAAFYDVAGRGPWLGPILLGLCRAGNLGAGVLAGVACSAQGPGLADAGVLRIATFAALPLVYGFYVFLVSRLGRLEDGEDAVAGRRFPPRLLIVAIALVLLTVCVVPTPRPMDTDTWFAGARRVGAFVLGAAGAWGLLRCAAQRSVWRPEHIMPVMGMALRRLLIFTAAVALLSGSAAGWIGAAVILAGFPLSFLLRRVFPPS